MFNPFPVFGPMNRGLAEDVVNLPTDIYEKIGPEGKNDVFLIVRHR